MEAVKQEVLTLLNMKRNAHHSVLILILCVILTLAACSVTPPVPDQTSDAPLQTDQSVGGQKSLPEIPEGATLAVYYFDVGQANCVVAVTGEDVIMIDAGDVGQDSLVLGYLEGLGITEIDYVIATHPHADHIGSMAAVVRAFDVGLLLMPDAVHTTSAYADLLDAIEERNTPVTVPDPGDAYKLGEGSFTILAPDRAYEDLNNASIVIRLAFGDVAFLFTGDAEAASEAAQLAAGHTLEANVLLVGHHGSNSSTTQSYLNAVSPEYAIISCGADNEYGHPHDEVQSRLDNIGAEVLRTDIHGTVTIITDGRALNVQSAKADSPVDTAKPTPGSSPNQDISYIGNLNSKKFHLPCCHSLPAEKNRTYFGSREQAVDSGYSPCGNCNP